MEQNAIHLERIPFDNAGKVLGLRVAGEQRKGEGYVDLSQIR